MKEEEKGASALAEAMDDSILMLARELEWAEAFAADYPDCGMGQVYLDFLRHELVTALG